MRRIRKLTDGVVEEYVEVQILSLEDVLKSFRWDGTSASLHEELKGIASEDQILQLDEDLGRANDSAPDQRIYCVDKSGIYCSEEGLIWVSGDKAFKSKDGFDVEVRDSSLAWRTNKGHGDALSSLRTILNAAGGIGAVLFSALLVAIIKPLFVMLGFVPDFTVNLWGKSGNGKTKMLKALTGLLRVNNRIQMNFTAHSKGEIMEAFLAGFGFPMLLDDYHPQKSNNSRQRQEALLDLLIRTVDDNPQTAFIFVTSEVLGGTYSTQDRMLQIHLQKQNAGDISAFVQACETLPEVCQSFLQKLTENFEDAKNLIEREFSNPEGKDTRLAWMHSYLLAAAKLFDAYYAPGKISLAETTQEVLKEQGIQQKKHMGTIDTTGKCVKPFAVVQDMFSKNSILVVSNYRVTYPNEIEIASNGDYIVRKVALQYAIDEMGLSASLRVKDLIDALSEAEVLVEEGTTHTTKYRGVRIYRIRGDRLKLIAKFFDTQ